ncbi:MAG TPA: hypothetical protein DCP38_17235 [Acidobacteria bacterium]|nr:hypothetical protein [Acidobacteriota bacterium]HAK57201.1 hypothetical protein [Acidobacteriota bacterium]
MGSPEVLVRGIIPVTGDGPLWVGVAGGELDWAGPNDGVTVVWVRDYEVRGAVLISGANRGSGERAGFADTASALGTRNERYRLENLGFQPNSISQADLRRYSFHRGAVFFPEPGCYEITAQVGRETATLYLNVEQP